MKKRKIDEEISLIPYYPNEEVTLKWYQDPVLCKQVDNIDFVYTPERLRAMYSYLSSHGECYYIEYKGVLVGDITLKEDEISIVVSKEYQNRHIGRRCVKNIMELAKEKNLSTVRAQIYDFNKQSQKMFMSLGFELVKDDWYEADLT